MLQRRNSVLWVLLIVAVLLGAYLVYAMLKPEAF